MNDLLIFFLEEIKMEKKINQKNRRQINFRLSKDEWEWIDYQIQTNKVPMSISAYAKHQTLYGEVNCIGISDDNAKIIATSIAKIGNNLNQLTKKINSGTQMPMHLYGSVVDDVADLKKLILKLLEVKEQKKSQKLTTDDKKLKLFFAKLRNKGISPSVGTDIMCNLMVALSKSQSSEDRHKLIADMISEKNISENLVVMVWQIYNEVFKEDIKS